MGRRLEELFLSAASKNPEALAVRDPTHSAEASYVELDRLSAIVAERLARAGVVPGDRVGVCIPKSAASVAAILGILRAGAAYVPVDAAAPLARNALIFDDCDVRAILCPSDRVASFVDHKPGRHVLDGEPPIAMVGDTDVALCAATPERRIAPAPADLAYILYTSGSTGRPKGVIHTHQSALAFVDWCVATFEPRSNDRFSSHAPFHFDLSIHDLWVPLTTGAAVILIGETVGKQPTTIADLVSEEEITVWYSTPSILRLLVEFGRMKPEGYGSLRIVCFAGEVFPAKHLRLIKETWARARFFNLYGPTETNVCTYYEIPAVVPAERTEPYAIGHSCSGDRCRVVDEHGRDVPPGSAGELVVAGPSLMVGYWNLPERSAAAFLRGVDGTSWYRTGDVVRDLGDQGYDFLGRRDRMVKRRGYRVELGEIEAALYRHPEVSEAAVVALPDDEAGLRVHAFVAWSGRDKPSLIRMKQFCAGELPLYMIPDGFAFPEALPRTSTDKVDYETLRGWAG